MSATRSAEDRPRDAQDLSIRASYEPPRVVLHSKDEIIRSIGPVVGCASWSPTSYPWW